MRSLTELSGETEERKAVLDMPEHAEPSMRPSNHQDAGGDD